MRMGVNDFTLTRIACTVTSRGPEYVQARWSVSPDSPAASTTADCQKNPTKINTLDAHASGL